LGEVDYHWVEILLFFTYFYILSIINYHNMLRYLSMLTAVFLLSSGIAPEKKPKPTIYLIGDSTVKNGSGKGNQCSGSGCWNKAAERV